MENALIKIDAKYDIVKTYYNLIEPNYGVRISPVYFIF